MALAAALAAAFVVHARAWEFLCDDAFISFRYARALAEHGALEFNPGERVEGYTNFLWVVVLAALHAVGVPPPRAAPVLTGLGALAGLVAAVLVARALRRRFEPSADPRLRALDLLPAVLLVSLPEHMVWAHGGLETSWAAALVLAGIAAWSSDRPRLAAALAAAAALLRPDGLLPLVVFGLAWLAVVGLPVLWRERRAALARLPRRRLVQAALVLAAPLVLHLLWRRSYYGAWLPNTWTIKAHGALLRDTYGRDYVLAWLDAMPLVYVAPLALLLRPRHLLLVLPIVAVVAYGWSVGGDFMAYGRFLVVATALTAGLVGWLLVDAGERLLGRRGPLAATLVGVALAAVLGVMSHERWLKDQATPAGWLDGRWEGVTAMDRFARERVHVGNWLLNNVPGDTTISVGAAGALPYASRLRAVDVYGLVDPWPRQVEVRPQVRARPGHQLMAPQSVILGRDPDLLCHVGHVGPRRPSLAAARSRGFGRDVVWACVEPGPVADPREPGGVLDLGYYCCLRRRGRTVGPFRDGAAP